MEIILLLVSLLLSFLFINYKYVTVLIALRTFVIIVLHFAYIYIYPDTNGLSPAYNDEIFFITEAFSGDFNFCLSKYIFNPSTYTAYINFLRIFKNIVFDLPLFSKMVNNFFFIILLIYTKKFASFLQISKRNIVFILYLLLISPSFIFFTSLVLRDVIIASVLMISLYYLIIRKRILFLINSLILVFLRKHLLVAVYFSLIFTIKKIKLKYLWLIALTFLCLLSVFDFPFYGSFITNLKSYFWEYWANLMGLNFLTADSGSFIVSPARVFIQRLIALDTFVPQIYLLFLIARFRKIIKIHKLTYMYFLINLLYLYFYWFSGNTAARVTILPFISIVYVQIFYYLSMIKTYKYDRKFVNV